MAYYFSEIIVKVEDSDEDQDNSRSCAALTKKFPTVPPKKKFKKFMCEICNKSFTYGTDLKRHTVVHTGEKPHQCEVCGKGLSTYYYMLQHKKAHSGERPYSCQDCGKRFALRALLSAHKKKCKKGEEEAAKQQQAETIPPRINIEKQDSEFACKICDRTYKHRGNLIYHTRAEHTGEKRYMCEYCGRSFTASHTLAVHKRLHTDERPYPCKFCDKEFASNSALNTHTKKKHSVDRF